MRISEQPEADLEPAASEEFEPALCVDLCLAPHPHFEQDCRTIVMDGFESTIAVKDQGELRNYELTSNVPLRDDEPSGGRIVFPEVAEHARIRTGNLLFDGLYAMAVHEALANSESEISNDFYENGTSIPLEAFRTGKLWSYVWTRDLSYSLHLALAGFDPRRAVQSLLFKASVVKSEIRGGLRNQIIQDTGSGGSYPVSTDRVVWALGVDETLKNLSGAERRNFLKKAYPILCDTIEQDRRLIFDPADGLYRGEHSFLDWREQTYPAWTKDNVLAIAMSKSVSVNAANYFLLQRASEYSAMLNRPDERARYAEWAAELKTAINAYLFDARAGLYRTYILADAGSEIPVSRYDLLGNSLAILFDIADEDRAAAIIRNYPTGPYGPPVVWPQEKGVPVYHNHGIWPFVVAYWIKAARATNHAEAVDLGVRSLEQFAALNLSNMENFDFITGRSHINDGPRTGPVVNSHRQLWSVAGYLSMVQDVVFGLETSREGIRFQPFITAKLRNETFGDTDTIELRNLAYLHTRNRVRIHLPPLGLQGVCVLDRVELNGRRIEGGFVKSESLRPENNWEIFLEAPALAPAAAPLRMADVSDERAICGPAQPVWSDGLAIKDGRVMLHYRHEDSANVTFNIYRDGRICAAGIRALEWLDPMSCDYLDTVRTYAVEAVDIRSGNVSHLTPAIAWRNDDQHRIIRATEMRNRGGELVENHHFEKWGKSVHELTTRAFRIERPGRYLVRVEFANGSGPVSTGITCAVKKLVLRNLATGAVEASGYVVMPQSGDWTRWDFSSPVNVSLGSAGNYAILLCEDEYSRNMSYLKNNERYTVGAGGGALSYNYVNVAAIHLLFVADTV
ncbi:MAG: hypothetical protein ACREKL_06930 [Chthoniobacterales bacterium]